MNPDDEWIEHAAKVLAPRQENDMQSESINELAAAMALAQGDITGAKKDAENPFFKSKYADLAANLEAGRPICKYGLAVIQTTENVTDGNITLVTTLVHKSGQWIRGVLTMKPKDSTPQAAGSCITYMRRYAYAAIVGLAQVDDDANDASGKTTNGSLKDDSGKPAGWNKQDTQRVSQYHKNIVDAAGKSNDEELLRLWHEAAEDHTFGTAVWVSLPKPIQHKIQDLKA
jgi:hypothetical protein